MDHNTSVELHLARATLRALPWVLLLTIVSAILGVAYWWTQNEPIIAAGSGINAILLSSVAFISRRCDESHADRLTIISTLLLYGGATLVTMMRPESIYLLFFPLTTLGVAYLLASNIATVVLGAIALLLSAASLNLHGIQTTEVPSYYAISVAWFAIPVIRSLRLYAASAAISDVEKVKAESLQDIAAGVAHTFNNLLHVIRAHAELGQATQGSDRTDAFEAIIHATEQGAEIGGTMRAYASQIEINPQLQDITALLTELQPTLRHMVPDHISVSMQLPNTRVRAIIDSAQFTTAVYSILRNSIEAVDDTPDPEVFVHAFAEDAALHLQISDNGPGIENKDRQRVFDPFYSTKGLGRGLGLTVALGIARSHGGSISLCNNKRGAITELTLPLAARGHMLFQGSTV